MIYVCVYMSTLLSWHISGGQKTISKTQFILWGLGMKGRLLGLVAHAFLGGARLPAFTLTFEHTET